MSSAPATTSELVPNWSTQSEEIFCPLCDYNLRGLTKPICPECGYTFEWQKLLDPTQRLHPYLFEHHPHRNVWSCVKTVLGSANPRRFWNSLNPWQPSQPGRLFLYWLVAAIINVGAFVAIAAPYMQQAVESRKLARTAYAKTLGANAAYYVSEFGSVEAYLDMVYPPPTQLGFYRQLLRGPGLLVLILAVSVLLWPWMTGMILLVFQQSMRRARVRVWHVLRCAIYSDSLLMMSLVIYAPAMIWIGLSLVQTGRVPALKLLLMWGLPCLAIGALAWGFSCWRLTVAYRRYMQFPHSLAVVAATQVILLLAVACVLALNL